MSAVQAAARNKPTRQIAKPLIERDPPPCTMPAFTKLQDAYHQTEAWLVRAADPISGKVTELKTLETLCSEVSAGNMWLSNSMVLKLVKMAVNDMCYISWMQSRLGLARKKHDGVREATS